MAASLHNSIHPNRTIALCTRRITLLHPFPEQQQKQSRVRHLSSTHQLQSKRKRTLPLHHLPTDAPNPPPYPYEPQQKLYKQHLTGLYGGSIIKFGNTVSEKNEIKTRRTWHPNVQHKRLFSLALGKFLRLKLTARVLRTVEKEGGIDEYLLGTKPQRVKELGPEGWRLRWLVLQTLRAQGSERVLADPLLTREVEIGDTLARLGVGEAPIDGDAPVELVDEAIERAVEEEEGAARLEEDDGELDIERRIRQRLNEDKLMREEVDTRPPTMLERAGNVIHTPVRWSRALARKIFRRP